ncbi:NAD-dependent protein deacylase [bacterium 3DAC]|nr:NAD-dependent protein deacylase [Dictyoglomota bacterium]UZN23589.1 NAD-dependent protein deacylase [bacterium 3DAC]
MESIKKLADMILESQYAIAFTGAGASTESGIPDFRGPNGLWKQYRAEEIASRWALENNTHDFFEFYRMRLAAMENIKPNRVHYGLAELENMGLLKAVITQNIDGLHKKAGSKRVYEIHGNIREAYCDRCGKKYPAEKLLEEDIPTCDVCGGIVRPNVVLFGEGLPQDQWIGAVREAEAADLVLSIGSSLTVYPAAMIPITVKEAGGKLVIINLEPTGYDSMADLVIHEKAGDVIEALLEEIKNRG